MIHVLQPNIIGPLFCLHWLCIGYVLTKSWLIFTILTLNISQTLEYLHFTNIALVWTRDMSSFHCLTYHYKPNISSILALHCKYVQCEASIFVITEFHFRYLKCRPIFNNMFHWQYFRLMQQESNTGPNIILLTNKL